MKVNLFIFSSRRVDLSSVCDACSGFMFFYYSTLRIVLSLVLILQCLTQKEEGKKNRKDTGSRMTNSNFRWRIKKYYPSSKKLRNNSNKTFRVRAKINESLQRWSRQDLNRDKNYAPSNKASEPEPSSENTGCIQWNHDRRICLMRMFASRKFAEDEKLSEIVIGRRYFYSLLYVRLSWFDNSWLQVARP